MEILPLYLRKREDRRVRAGHPWIFSNEVDVRKSPLSAFEAGQPVEILSSGGRFLGAGYINPHSLILARIVSRIRGEILDQALLTRRLEQALRLRERLFPRPFYRLVFGDSDGLPGLVVDRYGALLAVQFTTAGMERVRDEVLASLDALLFPETIVLRNDSSWRALEGLECAVEVALGTLPETVRLEENGAHFEISPRDGQKTGWYFDQRFNRQRLAGYVRGARILDVFSYSGGWGIQAALAGARKVLCVDTSKLALAQAEQNAVLNGVAGMVEVQQGNAFEVLKALHGAGERFDAVLLDPPAFIRRRKDLNVGIEAYRRLNRLAMEVLTSDGILVSCSCSAHLEGARLQALLAQAARGLECELQILDQGHQGADHPVHPMLPESAYLKAFFARVVRR